MSDMFNSLSDDIFLQGINNSDVSLDYSKINNITQKYMGSNASVSDKIFFLKLKNKYCQIKAISDYQRLQDEMYKDKKDIVAFEISRILKNDACDEKILEQINDIKKIVSLVGDEKITGELYKKVINLIIKIEVLLNMNVGLFNELCCLFENEYVNVENESIVDYTKKRINGE